MSSCTSSPPSSSLIYVRLTRTCYIAIPLYICGFVLLGASFEKHLSVGALVMGWGIAEVAVMINTVAVCEYSYLLPSPPIARLTATTDAYCNDCFPRMQGEISGLINLARTLGGFSVAYFQVPWAMKNGALQTFGVEAAIVTGLFLLIVPALQLKGAILRVSVLLSDYIPSRLTGMGGCSRNDTRFDSTCYHDL